MATTKTYSDLKHIPIIFFIQAVVWLVCHNLWAGALAGYFVVAMREVTQEEYRWIAANGGLRAAMPEGQGYKFWTWNKHSILETVYATAAAIIFAAAVTFLLPLIR